MTFRLLPRRHWQIVVVTAAVTCFPVSPGAAQPAAPEVVKTLCAGCHGADGNSVAPTFPKLAGQSAAYLEKQLLDYLAGRRRGEIMASILPQLNKSDVPGIAAFYAAQPIQPAPTENAKAAAAGKKIYDDGNVDSGVPACGGCHGDKGEGNDRYPRVGGQFPAYTLIQMQEFKSGKRNNDKGKVMRAVAERMTDAEMQAVSEYLAALK
ncbi:MAG: cytochrome c4 [Burkholderiales bacterium]|nr:cytochrome c4 [Burkholderiales bacterium]